MVAPSPPGISRDSWVLSLGMLAGALLMESEHEGGKTPHLVKALSPSEHLLVSLDVWGLEHWAVYGKVQYETGWEVL